MRLSPFRRERGEGDRFAVSRMPLRPGGYRDWSGFMKMLNFRLLACPSGLMPIHCQRCRSCKRLLRLQGHLGVFSGSTWKVLGYPPEAS
jgi:hypothetical protein